MIYYLNCFLYCVLFECGIVSRGDGRLEEVSVASGSGGRQVVGSIPQSGAHALTAASRGGREHSIFGLWDSHGCVNVCLLNCRGCHVKAV